MSCLFALLKRTGVVDRLQASNASLCVRTVHLWDLTDRSWHVHTASLTSSLFCLHPQATEPTTWPQGKVHTDTLGYSRHIQSTFLLAVTDSRGTLQPIKARTVCLRKFSCEVFCFPVSSNTTLRSTKTHVGLHIYKTPPGVVCRFTFQYHQVLFVTGLKRRRAGRKCQRKKDQFLYSFIIMIEPKSSSQKGMTT